MTGKSKRVGDCQGFTLIETLVVVLILGVVSIGLYQMLTTSRASYEQQKVTMEMQQNARVGLEALAADFRHVSYGKDPTQPSIHYAGPDSVTFIADIIPDVPGAEKISYSLSSAGDPGTPNPGDTILLKAVADSGGTALFVEPQSYGIKSGGLSFRYFNGMAVELPNPVPQPELIGEILIEITAMEPRAHRRLQTYLEEKLSATIYPRNLPLTPARSRPSKPPLGTLAMPNCESVTVPWTRPTTYTDGTELPLNQISHFTLYVGTSSDDLTLHARLARTMTQWTVDGLTGGSTYYFAVTATSTSDVESFYNMVTLNLSSPLYPSTSTGVVWQSNPSGPGLRLDWDVVDTFEDGTLITTPVDYHVYRDTAPGVLPIEPNLLATIPVSNWYTDTTTVDCDQYYYIVTAEACGNAGAPPPEVNASLPAPCSCVGPIDLALGEFEGDVLVDWSPPTSRADGSPLDPADISGYRVYYNTDAYTYEDHISVPASPTECMLSGLEGCVTYYVNIVCIDDCPNAGEICNYNEASIQTAEPCDPDIPTAPPSLNALALADRVDLSWPANTTDCDLYGYRVYYGSELGGPYEGSGAAEGPSPVLFSTGSVLDGDSCRAALTQLPACETYYMIVSAVDGCEPRNESAPSPEVGAQTNCTPCTADAGCAQFLASGGSFQEVHVEVYPTDGFPMTITQLVPSWSGPALIDRVWAGRPLIKIWAADGSAGGDGDVGPQGPDTYLNVDDFEIPGSASSSDGLPMMLDYDDDLRGQTLNLTFAEGGNVCSAEPREVIAGLVFDDFDDGDYDGWVNHSGAWTVEDGELYQSSSTGVRLLTWPVQLSNVAFEAKLKNVGGQTPYLVFAYEDSQNFYMLGLKTVDDKIRLCKRINGVFTITAQGTRRFSNDEWYHLRVEVAGNTARAYLNCEQVLEVTDPDVAAAGRIGLRTYVSRTYYDDIRVAAFTPVL